MAPEGPVDLIRLEGDGTSVTVRITGKDGAANGSGPLLAGEILIDTPFVRGSVATPVTPSDLTEWQEALDALDTGDDIGWRTGRGTAEVSIALEPDGERAQVTVTDTAKPPTSVTVPVVVTDSWFDEAYGRLDEVLRTWP